MILKSLNDSKTIAKTTFGPDGTFNNFKFNNPVARRIDFIFVSSNIKIDKYAVLSDSKNCHYPTDHLPVFVTLKL